MKDVQENIYIIYPSLVKYPLIIKYLKKNEKEDGLCYISQKLIGEKVGLSQTDISKYMKKL